MKIYQVIIIEQTIPHTELYFTSFPSKEEVINKLFYKLRTPKPFSDYFHAISYCEWPILINDEIFPELIIIKYIDGSCSNIIFEITEVNENE